MSDYFCEKMCQGKMHLEIRPKTEVISISVVSLPLEQVMAEFEVSSDLGLRHRAGLGTASGWGLVPTLSLASGLLSLQTSPEGNAHACLAIK